MFPTKVYIFFASTSKFVAVRMSSDGLVLEDSRIILVQAMCPVSNSWFSFVFMSSRAKCLQYKKAEQQKKAWDRGEDTDDDDDKDDDDIDEAVEERATVADEIEWDNLESEDALTCIVLSSQASGPFLFHEGEGTSGELVETGRTVGPPQE